MSSMRNVIQRRNHRERAQPREREKWGILEKHKDYSLRAKDYNEKKARLKVLRQKADDRNPDEFNYGMLSGTANHGRKVADRGNRALGHDAVKLLKTQDAAYLRNAMQENARAIAKLEQEYLLDDSAEPQILGDPPADRRDQAHVVYTEDVEEQMGFRTSISNGTKLPAEPSSDIEVVDRVNLDAQQSRKQMEKRAAAAREMEALKERHRKEQNSRQTKLTALKFRDKELRAAEHELELQRGQMSNSVGGVTKSGKKWQIRERKK